MVIKIAEEETMTSSFLYTQQVIIYNKNKKD